MHVGLPPWAKKLPNLVKSPLQAALHVAHSHRFYHVQKRLDPNSPGIEQKFQDQEHLRNKKGGDMGSGI
jgi:hypothetical protein